MLSPATKLFLIFIFGQVCYILKRAGAAVRGPDATISGPVAGPVTYLKRNCLVLGLRFLITSALWYFGAPDADTLLRFAPVPGLRVELIVFLAGLASDAIVDAFFLWLGKYVPFLQGFKLPEPNGEGTH